MSIYLKIDLFSISDYAAGGFVNYGGRWALFLTTGIIPSSWDLSWLFCEVIQAKMFTPRDESEWNFLKNKASSLLSKGNFYMPINNKNGNLIWNNGSCEDCLNLMVYLNTTSQEHIGESSYDSATFQNNIYRKKLKQCNFVSLKMFLYPFTH